MKKILTFVLASVMVLGLAACGNSDKENGGNSEFASGEALLTAITETFKEDEKFPVSGGDPENQTMDKPGSFDISKTDDMDAMMGFPKNQIENIDSAASMVHAMNANIFTGAAYHLKDGADAAKLAEAVKENIGTRQWICGKPDQLVIIDGGNGYLVTAYGAEEIVSAFKNHATEVMDGAKILVEESVVENQ